MCENATRRAVQCSEPRRLFAGAGISVFPSALALPRACHLYWHQPSPCAVPLMLRVRGLAVLPVTASSSRLSYWNQHHCSLAHASAGATCHSHSLMKSRSKATYDVHDWGISAAAVPIVAVADAAQATVKAVGQSGTREGAKAAAGESPSTRRLPSSRKRTQGVSSQLAAPDQVAATSTSSRAQQCSRQLPPKFGKSRSLPLRRKNTSRRGYHSAAGLVSYSHSSPVGDWRIPLIACSPQSCVSLAPGRKPSVAYTRDYDEAEELLQCIPLGQPLGLDLEWNFNPKTGAGYKTALLQLCSSSLIVIIQLSAIKRIPPRLRQILEHKGTIKTGVAVKADCTKLTRDYGIRVNGVLELSSVARRAQVDLWTAQRRRGLISLQELCRMYLKHDLVKDETRSSDWTRMLTPKQVEYAASDAYVALEILGKLCGIVDGSGAAGEVVDGVEGEEESSDIASKGQQQHNPARCQEDLALAAFLGEDLPTQSRSRSGQSSSDAILLDDSDADEDIVGVTRRPLGTIETTSRVNTSSPEQQRRKPGWFAQPAVPVDAKNAAAAAPHASDPPSLALIKKLLHHNNSDVGST